MSDANVFNTAPCMKIEASWEMLDSRNIAKSRALNSMLLNVCHTLTLCVRTGLGTAVRKMSGLREVVVVGIHYQTTSLSLAANASQYREDYQRDPFYAVVGRYSSSGTRSVEATTDGYGNKCLRVCLCPIPCKVRDTQKDTVVICVDSDIRR
jgi:hypothetical protein